MDLFGGVQQIGMELDRATLRFGRPVSLVWKSSTAGAGADPPYPRCGSGALCQVVPGFSTV
jgi:hypothetical protein